MYHQHQGSSDLFSSRTTFPTERHLFLHGGNAQGDSGLVLSTDAKPRLKWTPELHQRFIEAVNQLGGAEKATPKTVMRLMGIPGLTLYHLKSHLQKYRLSKNLQGQANIGTTKNAIGCTAAADRAPGMSSSGSTMSSINTIPQTEKTIQISEALQMQIEVQRQLNEQLEVQRHLQLRIEAQGKYLQAVLEQAQETLGRQNLGSASLEDAKIKISELVSQVSSECFSNATTDLKENPIIHKLGPRQIQYTDSSISYMTAGEEFTKEQKLHNYGGTKAYDDGSLFGNYQGHDQESQFALNRSFSENRMTHFQNIKEYERTKLGIEGSTSFLSEYVKTQKDDGGSTTSSASGSKERDVEKLYLEEPSCKRQAVQRPRETTLRDLELPCFSTKLDLNTHDIDDTDQGARQFDLNGFSWS